MAEASTQRSGLRCPLVIGAILFLFGGGLLTLGLIWLTNAAKQLSNSPPLPNTDFQPLANCTVASIEHCWSQTRNTDARSDVCTDNYRVRFTAAGSSDLLDADPLEEHRPPNTDCQSGGCANSTAVSSHGGASASPVQFGITYSAGGSYQCWEPVAAVSSLHASYSCANDGCIKLFSPSEYADAYLAIATTGTIAGAILAATGLFCACCAISGVCRVSRKFQDHRTVPSESFNPTSMNAEPSASAPRHAIAMAVPVAMPMQ